MPNGTVFVLIVAKCIVNYDFKIVQGLRTAVLIVAKCIVNIASAPLSNEDT